MSTFTRPGTYGNYGISAWSAAFSRRGADLGDKWAVTNGRTIGKWSSNWAKTWLFKSWFIDRFHSKLKIFGWFELHMPSQKRILSPFAEVPAPESTAPSRHFLVYHWAHGSGGSSSRGSLASNPSNPSNIFQPSKIYAGVALQSNGFPIQKNPLLPMNCY